MNWFYLLMKNNIAFENNKTIPYKVSMFCAISTATDLDKNSISLFLDSIRILSMTQYHLRYLVRFEYASHRDAKLPRAFSLPPGFDLGFVLTLTCQIKKTRQQLE